MILLAQEEIECGVRIALLKMVDDWRGNEHVTDSIVSYKQKLARVEINVRRKRPVSMRDEFQKVHDLRPEPDLGRFENAHAIPSGILQSL